MLPVSAWPPGPPGASLSPFGAPRQINVSDFVHGFVIPKGAWIVSTGSNQVVMFFPQVDNRTPARTPGTGLISSGRPRTRPPCGCPPKPQPTLRPYNETVEQFRAWQRTTGETETTMFPPPGRRPPNWFGWRFVCAPCSTLVPSGCTAGQLVIADGQNVVITGGGFATITQAYSV